MKARNIAASLFASGIFMFVVTLLGAPLYLAFGLGYLAYLLFRLGDKVKGE